MSPAELGPVLSSERKPTSINLKLFKENIKENEKKNWSGVPDGGLTPGLSIGLKITLTFVRFRGSRISDRRIWS
jgi:hypothetical protein